jgi:hypothetical protein
MEAMSIAVPQTKVWAASAAAPPSGPAAGSAPLGSPPPPGPAPPAEAVGRSAESMAA